MEETISCSERKGTIETVNLSSLQAIHVCFLPLVSRLLHQTAAVQSSLLSWKYGFLIHHHHHHHHLGLNKYHQSRSLSSRLEWKQARIPTPLAAAGYPAPVLTWYNLPALSSPETSLQLNCALPSQLQPHFISLHADCVEAVFALSGGTDVCLWARRRADKISRGPSEVQI